MLSIRYNSISEAHKKRIRAHRTHSRGAFVLADREVAVGVIEFRKHLVYSWGNIILIIANTMCRICLRVLARFPVKMLTFSIQTCRSALRISRARVRHVYDSRWEMARIFLLLSLCLYCKDNWAVKLFRVSKIFMKDVWWKFVNVSLKNLYIIRGWCMHVFSITNLKYNIQISFNWKIFISDSENSI